MGVHCKVSCEVNLSKGRKYTADEEVIVMKPFTCEICSKSFNNKWNMQGHVKEVHNGKHRDVKHNGKHGDVKHNGKHGDVKHNGKHGDVKHNGKHRDVKDNEKMGN